MALHRKSGLILFENGGKSQPMGKRGKICGPEQTTISVQEHAGEELVLVCGEHIHLAARVSAELRFAQPEKFHYLLLLQELRNTVHVSCGPSAVLQLHRTLPCA